MKLESFVVLHVCGRICSQFNSIEFITHRGDFLDNGQLITKAINIYLKRAKALRYHTRAS